MWLYISQYLALLLGGCMLGSRTLYWSIIFSTNFCFSRRSSLSFSLKENHERHENKAAARLTKRRKGWVRRGFIHFVHLSSVQFKGLFWKCVCNTVDSERLSALLLTREGETEPAARLERIYFQSGTSEKRVSNEFMQCASWTLNPS